MSITEATVLPLTLGRQAEARRRLQLSQTGMAELLEVHRNTVSRWERDLEIPDFAVVVWLSIAADWPLHLFASAMGAALPWDSPDGPGTPSGLPDQASPCMTDNVVPLRGVEWGGRQAVAA